MIVLGIFIDSKAGFHDNITDFPENSKTKIAGTTAGIFHIPVIRRRTPPVPEVSGA